MFDDDENAPVYDPDVVRQILPFDPFDPAFKADPYPVYEQLRAQGPLISGDAGVAATGHQACSVILRDNRFGWGDGALVADQFTEDDEGNEVRPFIFMDPPDHTRIRKLVSKTFAARSVERMRPRARQVMADLLAKVDEAGPGATVDFVDAIAYPLPAIVLAELLGVPVENHKQLRDWSEAIGRGLDTFVLTAKEFAERDEARAQLDDFFAELVAKRRVEPTDDLVSALVAVEQEGDRLTEIELVTTCRMILSAGYITTVNWITNGMLALLENPDQLAWLREHRDQIPGAADELLRYDAPIQMVSRTALTDAEIDGLEIPEGTPLLLIIAAGNRDPEVYPEPTKLDLSRPAGRNLAFGLGIHFCVGAPVARLATEVALEALLDRDITLAGDPVRAKTFIVRGLAKLPVVMSR